MRKGLTSNYSLLKMIFELQLDASMFSDVGSEKSWTLRPTERTNENG